MDTPYLTDRIAHVPDDAAEELVDEYILGQGVRKAELLWQGLTD